MYTIFFVVNYLHIGTNGKDHSSHSMYSLVCYSRTPDERPPSPTTIPLIDHISCDGQWFLFVYESLTSDHPSYTTTPMWFWGWSYKRGSTVLQDYGYCDFSSEFLIGFFNFTYKEFFCCFQRNKSLRSISPNHIPSNNLDHLSSHVILSLQKHILNK